jgi:outer membrane protein TolC
MALAARPMLAAARQEASAAVAGERLARRELVPDLEVGVQLGRRPASATPPDEAEMMGRRADWMGGVMVGASVPVFARRRQLAMREEAAAMRRMADADVRAMAAETRGRVRELWAAASRARTLRGLRAATLLPQAEATREAAAVAYRAATLDFMTLLEAQMTVNRVRQEVLALVAEEGRALAELEMLVGQPLLDADATEADDPMTRPTTRSTTEGGR